MLTMAAKLVLLLLAMLLAPQMPLAGALDTLNRADSDELQPEEERVDFADVAEVETDVEATKRNWMAELMEKGDQSDETLDLIDEIQTRSSSSGLRRLESACKAMCSKCICGVILMPSFPAVAQAKPKKTAKTLKPVKPMPKPVKSTAKPVKPTPKPVKPMPKPVKPTAKPVKPTPKPVKPTPKPVKPKPKPVKPTPKPVKPTPKPVKPTLKPVKPTPKPVKPTPKPVKPTPKPVKPTPKPVKPTIKPSNPTPKQAAAPATEAVKKARKWVYADNILENQLPDFLLDEGAGESAFKREVDDHDPLSNESLGDFGIE